MDDDENRKIPVPQLNWNEPFEPRELDEDLISGLKESLTAFCGDQKVNPHKIKFGLKEIDFHKNNPEIYKIIENFCTDYDIIGEEVTVDDFVDQIINELGNVRNRKGVNYLFNTICNKEQKITPKEMFNVFNENGGDLTLDEVKTIMKEIAEPNKNFNINQDEFYYIMTRKPNEIVQINEILTNENPNNK